MKISSSLIFALTAIGTCSALVGCGGSPPPPYIPPAGTTGASTQSPEVFSKAYQNPAGCLDVSKVAARAHQSKISRLTWTDVSIDETTPVSEAFARSVVHNTTATDSPLQNDDLPTAQQGCDSVDYGTFGHLKIISASPTQLVLERRDSSHIDGPGTYSQYTFQLTARSRLQLTMSVPFTTPHECISQESHEVTNTFVVDFGGDGAHSPRRPRAAALAPAVGPSAALADLKARAAAYDDPTQQGHEKDLENAYCAKVKPPAPPTADHSGADGHDRH